MSEFSFEPENRIGRFFEQVEPRESWGDRVLAGATRAETAMILVDGEPAVGFRISGAVVGNPAELFELLKLLEDAGRGQRQEGGQ